MTSIAQCLAVVMLMLASAWSLADSQPQTASPDSSPADAPTLASAPREENGGYLEVGVLAGLRKSPYFGLPEDNAPEVLQPSLSLSLAGRYQYEGLFAEGYFGSAEGLVLGANLLNQALVSLDLVAMQGHPSVSGKDSNLLSEIRPRRGDLLGGVRSTLHYGDLIAQAHLLHDISQVHNGNVFGMKLGINQLVGNWNLHALVGANYRSRAVADYYFSLSEREIASLIYIENKVPEAFRAEAGWTPMFELGASYPLSERWVFRSLFRYQQLPEQWSGSALLIDDVDQEFLTSLSYVF